jgi:AcrR family transcriptional regulator
MPRPALQPAEIESFRQRLCDVALARFAEHGYDGFTLRGLAAELGCSHATPYRYFRSKAEIFAAVQALAFERFANALQERVAGVRDPLERIDVLGRTYQVFARKEPQAYRIMFQLEPAEAPADPGDRADYRSREGRSWSILRGAMGDAVERGELHGDPELLAMLFWANMHGIAALDLTGKFDLPYDELVAHSLAAFRAAHTTAGGPR